MLTFSVPIWGALIISPLLFRGYICMALWFSILYSCILQTLLCTTFLKQGCKSYYILHGEWGRRWWRRKCIRYCRQLSKSLQKLTSEIDCNFVMNDYSRAFLSCQLCYVRQATFVAHVCAQVLPKDMFVQNKYHAYKLFLLVLAVFFPVLHQTRVEW